MPQQNEITIKLDGDLTALHDAIVAELKPDIDRLRRERDDARQWARAWKAIAKITYADANIWYYAYRDIMVNRDDAKTPE